MIKILTLRNEITEEQLKHERKMNDIASAHIDALKDTIRELQERLRRKEG